MTKKTEAGTYIGMIALALAVVWAAWGWTVGLAALGVAVLTWLVTVFTLGVELGEARESLEEADDELDLYDELRVLVADGVASGSATLHLDLEAWLDEHPPSQVHLERREALTTR